MSAEKKKVDALTEKLEVKYCIPEWLRDTQIRASCARFKDRIQPCALRDEPIALVCFGPSLNKSWEHIREFAYVMTCSGSHKFLMDRGIVPTWHVEVDPRSHKIKLIGDNIHKSTTFLLASCVHPEVFDHVEKSGAKIVLWHTYSGEKREALPVVYPRGEWVSTGGANVGLRAMVLCRMLGFRDIHLFGMDGSFAPGEMAHADEHPNRPKDWIMAQFNGKEYATTTAFLECARGTLHELEMLPDCHVTFYGSGLIQDMVKAKQGELKKKERSTIAFYCPHTISKEYIEQNRILHEQNPYYGTSAVNHVDTIKNIFKATECKSLLDYGCGKGLLAKHIDFPIWEYDPAVPGKDTPPRPADLVVCIDTLEHIEPDYLLAVLGDIARCCEKVGYFVIGTGPAKKTLPDGRNTHLIQEGKDWWREKLSLFFDIPNDGIKEINGQLHIIVGPKAKINLPPEKFVLTKESHELQGTTEGNHSYPQPFEEIGIAAT